MIILIDIGQGIGHNRAYEWNREGSKGSNMNEEVGIPAYYSNFEIETSAEDPYKKIYKAYGVVVSVEEFDKKVKQARYLHSAVGYSDYETLEVF